ncbi:hypothetical protein BDZ88DRAFT_427108 [Geranomyces variabilis]|nr:hypothetical protein BDZ88DRAFT_427108 [Geranomyces variabilis]KAJ3143676.1 hypothetical protein HDU90_000441 [Geranomyces variabilis]
MSQYSRVPLVDSDADSPLRISIRPPSPAPSQQPPPPSVLPEPQSLLPHHSQSPPHHVSVRIPSARSRPPKPQPRHMSPLLDDDNDEDLENDHHLLLSDSSDGDPFSPLQPPPKFIKLLGQPKPSSSGADFLDTDPLTGAPIKPTPASVVSASNADPSAVLVDVLDATNEDPFTLEPFAALIDLCAERDKDFVLARVTTVDPNDEERLYYSYYAAHHINKVLFRTQPEEGLLHRMKAKNPLNNMTIVGDVHYFVVSAAAPSESPQNTGRGSFDSVRSLGSIRSFSSIRSATSIRSMMSVFSTASVGSTGSGRREFDRFRRKQPRAKSSSVNPHDTENSKAGLSRLLRIGQHGCRKRTLHLIMRPDAVENVVEDVVPLTEEEGGKGIGIDGKGVYTRPHGKYGRIRPASAQPGSERVRDISASVAKGPPVGSPNGTAPGEKLSRSRRNSMDDAYVEDADKMTPNGSVDRDAVGTTANFRAGSTTPRIHRRVRSISFSNEHNGAANLPEWIKTHSGSGKLEGELGDATSRAPGQRGSHHHHNHHPSTTSNGVTNGGAGGSSSSSSFGHRRTRTPLLEQALLSPQTPHSASPLAPDPIYYVARFYATDDDFLMKAAVRAYFKEHALETSDAVLFTIPSSRDDSSEAALDGAEAHPALTGFVYAVSEDYGPGWLGAGGRSGRSLKWLLLAYVALGFVLIKFVVPDAYAYIIAFVLIFLMCLVMILCL